MEVVTPLVDEVRDLAARAAQRGSIVAFQSTLAAATQAVQRALGHEETASRAALSLAQTDALAEMTGELRSVSDALQGTLDAQGRCLMPVCGESRKRGLRLRRRDRDAASPAERPTWWFSLTEAIEALEEGANRMRALANGQPAEAPSRVLSESTAELLRTHHDRLVDEADRWIG